jgi:hypothetical protein
MYSAASRSQLLLARVVIGVIVACLVAGAVFYGLSAEVRERFWTNMHDRPGGPMAFRFVLQPIMAIAAAFMDGVKDGKSGRAPYLLTVITNPVERPERLREGVIATARIMLIGLVVDAIYQFAVLKSFYPGEAVAITITLAFLPYVLTRGPVARIARRWNTAEEAKQQ